MSWPDLVTPRLMEERKNLAVVVIVVVVDPALAVERTKFQSLDIPQF